MKLVTAIIRAYQLDQVRESLIQAGITRITVSRVSGHGNQVSKEVYRGKEVIPNLTPKMRLEIAVNDEFVETTIDAIIKAAKSHGNMEITKVRLVTERYLLHPLSNVSESVLRNAEVPQFNL